LIIFSCFLRERKTVKIVQKYKNARKNCSYNAVALQINGKSIFKNSVKFLVFLFCRNPIFPRHSVILCSNNEGNPLSSLGGRLPKGSIPLTLRIFLNCMRVIAIGGDARAAGAEARCAKSSQERLLVSLKDFYRACVSNICGIPRVFPDYIGPIGCIYWMRIRM
jgi:hypothetical protein